MPLRAGRVGVDFNPTVDRLRVTTSGDQNFRYNPVNGAVVDGDAVTPRASSRTRTLAYAAGDPGAGDNPTIVDVAYDRNFQGATLTTLYGIDATQNTLVGIGGIDGTPSPNGGQLSTVGALGVDVGDHLGFDIAADGTAYRRVRERQRRGTAAAVHGSNLATGAATNLGMIGNGTLQFDGLTVLPRDEIVFAVTASNRLIRFRADRAGPHPERRVAHGPDRRRECHRHRLPPRDGRTVRLHQHRTASCGSTRRPARPRNSARCRHDTVRDGLARGGFDFNPTVDRLRLVNAANDNLRFNPLTFAVVDSDNNPANGTQATPTSRSSPRTRTSG